MQCLLSLWHSMIFTWVNSWVSCFCSKIVFENLVQEDILIRYISLAAIFYRNIHFFRRFNWPRREITEPDVKYFPKITSRISKNVQHNLIYRMSNEQGGFKRFPRIVLIPKPKLTIMNRAASEDSQELFWWQVAKNANICLKTLADPTMNTTSFISSTTLLRNSVKSSPSSSKPIKKKNFKH